MDSPQRNCPLITTKIESLHLDTLVSSQHMLHHQPFLTKMNLTDQSLMNTPVLTKMPTKEINVNSTIRLQLLTTIVRDQLRIKDRKSLENILRWKTNLEIRNQLINELQEEFEDTKGAIEEEQTIQFLLQKDKQRSTKHTYKTKDRVTRIPLKTGGELRSSGRVSSSYSTSDTRRVNLRLSKLDLWAELYLMRLPLKRN